MSYRVTGDAARKARERYELKQAAAEFYRKRNVPERLEEALNSTFCLGPEDVYGHLANYFAQFSMPPTICQIRGRKVLDGSGEPTVEVEVSCTVKNSDKRICSSVISAVSEHPKASEGLEQERNHSADTAIQWLTDLSPLLKGMSPNEQHNIDQLLSDFYQPKIEEEKARRQMEREASPMAIEPVPSPVTSPALVKKKGSGKGKKAVVMEKPIPPEEAPEPVVPGSPAIGALSLAVAKASSVLGKTPLYLHIAALRNEKLPSEFIMPTPMISVLSCGKSSPGKLNLMKEVLVIPPTGLTVQQSLDMALMLQNQIVKQINSISKTGPAIKNVTPLGCMLIGGDRIEQPLDLICEACQHVGLELGRNLYLAINCAAHELMDYNKAKYEALSGTFKSPDEMVDLYVDLINRQPAILALLDPLRKEDAAQWESLTKALGSKCFLFADASSKPVCKLLESADIHNPPCSGTVIKHTNETTVSQLLGSFKLIEGENRVTILGCPCEESVDDSIADLAVGLGARFVKLGGLLRGERSSKYNRLLAIEDELTQAGTLGFWTKHEFPILSDVENLPGPEEVE